MKNLKIALFSMLALGLTLTSCGDDDNGGSSIEGKWVFSKTGEIVNGEETLEPYGHAAGCDKDYIRLTDDNRYKGIFYDEGCEEDSDNGTWSKNGNTLTIEVDNNPAELKIINLSDTQLKVKTRPISDDSGEDYEYVTVFTRG